MELSTAEINYISAIHRLSADNERVSTSELANEFGIAAASVTDMVQKLAEKEVVRYEKYKGVSLLPIGIGVAESTTKNDAVWLQFMQEKLQMTESESIQAIDEFRKVNSPVFIQQLETFLQQHQQIQLSNNQIVPKDLFDSEDREQNNTASKQDQSITTLADLTAGQTCIVLGIKTLPNDLQAILQHFQIPIGAQIKVGKKFTFDQSIAIEIKEKMHIVSKKVAEQISVQIN